MKKKFTLLIALALIFSAANAQQKRGERINAAHQIEQGTISNGLTLMKATGTDVNTPMPVMRAPGDVLFSQNFNAATFPPTDWTMINSTGTNWVRQTTAAANGPTVYDGGFAWRADVDAGAGQYSYLITPQINIPATGSYALTFMSYIGYAGYYGASSVRISTTTPDRAEFTTVYTLAGSDIAQSWQKIMIGLSAYAGQSIYIAFVYGDPGDYDHNWGIDNVAITELNDNDLKITANAYPFSQVPTNQQLILSAATVTNNGSATQNNLVVNVTYNGAVIATETLSSLAPGAQHVFNFDAYVGYPVSGNNTLAYNVTQNESDAYIADNTFTTTFTGTSSIFATDEGDLTYSTYYGGTGSANYRFGTIYTFSKPTVLNRVQVYLYSGHATTANAYTLRVQQVTSPTTASATALVTQQFTVATPTGTTWATVTLPTPANLPAGDYFVSISCTTTANNLLGDNGSAGRNKCVATTSAGTALNYQSGSAFLHLVVDLQPNDIAITPTTGFPYAQIPQSIAGDLPFPTTLTATAINVGTDAQSSITLSATYNGADMGTSTPPIATLASGATSAAMTVTPPAGTAFPTTLGTNDVVYTVAQGETDANPGDNTVTRNFDITKDIYALDHIPSTITSGGVGYGGSTPSGLGYKVGNIFTISAPVTLKQVQIGYGIGATATNHNLVLYRATLSGSTYSVVLTDVFTPVTVARPAGGGWLTIDVPPTELEPGLYFLGVQSTANDNHAVAYDNIYGNTIYLAATGAAGASVNLSPQTGSFGAGAIRMVLATPCTPPTALTVNPSDITTEGAVISWTAGDSETEWTLEYSLTDDFADVLGTVANITPDPTYTFTGLEPSTTYYVRIKSVCGANESDWSDVANFTTEAESGCTVTLPLNENFETDSWQCWTMISNNAVNGPGGTGTYPMGVVDLSGVSHVLQFSSFSSAPDYNQYFISPAIPTNSGLKVTFDYARASISGTELFKVGYSSTNDDIGSFTWGTQVSVTNTSPTFNEYSLMVPAGTKYVAINYCSNYQYRLYIDNIVLAEPTAYDAAITAITAPVNGIDLTATEPVTVTIKNNGTNDITSTNLHLELTVDGGTPMVEAFSGSNIASDAILSYTLTNTADLSAVGDHSITVRAILDGDANNTNDAMTVTVTNTICNVITTYPFVEDFEGYAGTTYSTPGIVPPCWFSYGDVSTVIPHITGSGSYWYPHTGSKAITFTGGASYAGENSYVVLPPFDKSLDQLSISFWYRYESATQGTLTVGYLTGDQTNVSSYVPLFTVPATTTITQAEYNLANAGMDLSAATYIAFRWNYTGASFYSAGIDDINVNTLPDNDAAITAITAPASGINLSASEPVTVTIKNYGANDITSTNMNLELTVDGGTPMVEAFAGSNIATSATLSYTLTNVADLSAAGDHTITVRAILVGDENAANDSKTITVTNTVCDAISTFPWSEGFEGSVFPPTTCWSNIDADGDGYSWVINDPAILAHTGTQCATSASYNNPTYSPLTPNNYLITPKLILPSGIISLSFWVAAQDPLYPADHYSVKVSTTDTNPTSFTQIFDETLTAGTSDWVERTVDLSAYAGQNIYVAFVHNNCTDEFVMKLDDILIDVTDGINNNNSTGNISVYPNPVTSTLVITNAAGSKAKIFDVSGKTVLELPVQDAYQTVDMSNVSAGVYFLELQSQTSTSTVKLIKK